MNSEQVVQFAEDYLAKQPRLGGAEFSSADIMMLFPLNFAMQLNTVDKDQFPNVNAWRARMRPARPISECCQGPSARDGRQPAGAAQACAIGPQASAGHALAGRPPAGARTQVLQFVAPLVAGTG